MALPLFIIACCIALSRAVVPICVEEIGKYLTCMTNELDNPTKSKIYVNEYVNDFQTVVGQSFDSTLKIGQQELQKLDLRRGTVNPGVALKSIQKCVWDSAANLNRVGDFLGPNGPLKGNKILRQAAISLRDYLFTNQDVAIKNCLRRALYNSLYDEIKGCVGQKLGDPDFKSPAFPMFNRTPLTFSEQLLQAIDKRAWVHNGLFSCHRHSPRDAQHTENLIKQKSADIYKSHCNARKTCLRFMTQTSCANTYVDIRKHSCSCVKQRRDVRLQTFLKARDSIDKFDDQIFCVNQLQNGIGGWGVKLQKVVSNCVHPEPSLYATIDQHLAVDKVCSQLKLVKVQQRIEILDAIQGFHSFLAAVNDGYMRYCDMLSCHT